MKKIIYLILIVFGFLLAACEKIVDIEKKPEVRDREANFTIQIIDSTGILQKSLRNKTSSRCSSLVASLIYIMINIHSKLMKTVL